MMASFWRQTYYLTYRNFLLKIRMKQLLSQEIFLPIILVSSILIVNLTNKPRIYNEAPYGAFSNYPLLDANSSVSFMPDDSKPWAFTPNNSDTWEVMQRIKSALGERAPSVFLSFPDEEQMVTAYRSQPEPQFSIGIVFGADFPQNLMVALRMPFEAMPPTDENSRFASQASCRAIDGQPPGLASYNCPANRYLFSGFAVLQTVMQNAISSMLTNETLSLPDVSVRMFPKDRYVEASSFPRVFSSIYYVLMYTIFVAALLSIIVSEKEKKIKETMLVMGMSNGPFWLAWFITYSVIMLFVALVIALLSKYAIQNVANGNFLIIFLIMYLYGMSIICIAFMLTPFFNKATVAGAIGSLLTFLLSLIYLPLGLIANVPSVYKWLVSFFSPAAMALAIDQAATLDEGGAGIQFDNMGLDGFPPYVAMLAIDCVIYLLLAFYFDNVVPGTYGQRKPLGFCCMPSYWQNRQGEAEGMVDLNTLEDVPDVELVPQEMKDRAGIRIRSLSKTFKGGKEKQDVLAVKGVSLDIYEGQITCLLGHNGAGKTTLINTLTGLIAADSGQATIYGYSIRDPIQMQKIRSMVGVCPQENTLFENLSPREHLKVYAGLKGVPTEDIEEQVMKILKLTLLDQSENTQSKDLSGGQKRKLCVGIALIGDPKILFLDEPSSGMDPYSRRQLWNLLKSQRQGRIMVLTTHFMDEADILADRKAVMSQGNLRCYGSSLFLKNRFGIGYHLGMVVEPDVDVDRITQLVTAQVPNGQMSRSHGMELAYTLPLEDTSKFPDLFRAFEETSGQDGATVAKQLGIQSYGVSMTTLEEVFLKLNDEEMEDTEENEIQNATDTTPLAVNSLNGNYQSMAVGSSESVSLNVEHLITAPLEPNKYQLRGLCILLFKQMIRDPGTYFSRVFFPIIYIVLSVVLSSTISFGIGQVDNPSSLTLDPSLYLQTDSPSTLPLLSPLLYQNNLTVAGDIQPLLNQLDRLGLKVSNIPDMSNLSSVAPHSMATIVNSLGPPGDFLALYNDTAQHSLPILLSVLGNVLVALETPTETLLNLTFANHPLPSRAMSYSFNSGFFLVLFLAMAICFVPIGYCTNIVKERQEKVRTQLRVSGVKASNYWCSHLLIDTVQVYFITVVAAIIILIISAATGGSSLATGGGMFMFFIFMIIYSPLLVLFSYCVAFLFDDYKTCQSASQLIFFYGAIILAVPTLVLDFSAYNIPAAAIHLVFSILFPPYTIFGFLYYIDKVYQVAVFSQTLDELSFGDYFNFDTLIVPTLFCLLVSHVCIFFLLRFLEIQSTGGNLKDTFFFSEGKVGHVIANSDHIPDEDSDVRSEREKVEGMFNQGHHPEKCAVAVCGIRKEFQKRSGGCCKKQDSTGPINVAVRNLTLSVNEGEVFGLLGPNGAGKTTSMNVITANTGATKGQVQIAGYGITSSLSEAFHVMGFCPQHDPLYENITMREHIELYGLLKGIQPSDIEAIANHYMDGLKISEHADKRAQKLSGGTKRKLCFALSMLGRPKIVLMDEPSTGMDPTSKRFVWNTIISSFRDNRGAILTTHSMEEADAVCSRVGIMVSGQLQCLGTTQHLKGKYGGGYVLEIKLNPGPDYYSMDHTSGQATRLLEEMMSALDRKIKEVFPSAEAIERFGERVTYRVPSEVAISLSTVFAALEEGKETLHVEEYSFSQATLEQVFIEFAKMQRDDDEEPDAPSSPQRMLSRISVKSGGHSNPAATVTEEV
ncbi:ATP-binding cassette sub-family A member 5-like [Acanthaster planci]|uniref:ATP-binding cassette sub-family A member 5-like n=1 Tax=Acanthaster planci TaxID=133434 RepID=A0A8B7YM21_ACAPL|nr:ATP-binding cassette sub-family A member 5-like [Acanthaster planci]XP_022092522.1 ATP-binding cassette sub-family A member 5-like [Acanthaster planci]XP_022092523.1 ATP-binding cassette sub-family A member 5-like [Acanthaster planci]